MKILLVSPLPPPLGGIATWTLKYQEYCNANSIEVDIVNIALIGKRGKKSSGKRNIYDEIKRTLKIIFDIKKKMEIVRPDIVHINSSCSSFGILRDLVCVRIAKRKRIPVIFQCHCNVESQIKNQMGKSILKHIIKDSAAILTLNQNSCEYINDFKIKHSYIVPNFVEEIKIEKSHTINTQIHNVIFVGHVCEDKGCKEIIQVASKFPNIKFTLIGEISNEISAIKLTENVLLTGEKEPNKIKHLLKIADLFLFPSYREGFSIALTEAMAAGLPIIATDVGANQDMIESKGGIIVPVHSVESIVQAIEKLYNADVRKKMSIWNLNKVTSYYTQTKVMKKIFSLYEKIIY